MKNGKLITIALYIILSFASCVAAHAQAILSQEMFRRREFNVEAQVADSLTGEPVAFASAYMKVANDTLITNFALSDPEGKIHLKDVAIGEYDFCIEFMGYQPYRKRLYVGRKMDLKKILLKPDVKALKAAKVTANVAQMEVIGDTIVYNAAAFRTLSNGKLVDLLKQMPGVEIGKNGDVKVNGKTVSQITVEGKTFFMGDNSLALNNLPANIVNKVKVTEKESEAAEFSGIRDGDKKTVMDVELKEEFKKGVFGTLSASGGTSVKGKKEDQFKDYPSFLGKTSDMLSAYGEKTQFTAVFNGQNYKDREAYYMFSGAGGMSDELSINGAGVHAQTQTGANLNTDAVKGMSANISASFRTDRGDTRQKQEATNYVEGGDDVQSESTSTSNGRGRTFRTDMEFKNTNTKKFTIKFSPELKITDYNETVSGTSDNYVLGEKKNSGTNFSTENQKTIFTYGKLTAGVKKLGKARRSLTSTFSYSYGTSGGDSREQSSVLYSTGSSVDRDLMYHKNGVNYSYGGNIQYVEPFGKYWAVQGMVSAYYRMRESRKKAFDMSNYTISDYYTSYSDNRYLNAYGRLLGQFNKNGINLQFGGLARMVMNENISRSFGVETTTGKGEVSWIFSPFLKFNAKIKGHNFGLNYNMDSERPGASSILPVFNIYNPTRISAGNIYLRPSTKHSYSANAYGRFKRSEISYSVYMNGGVAADQTVSAIWFDDGGIRYSVPVNSAQPSWSNSVFLSMNRKLSKSGKWNGGIYADFSNRISTSYQSRGNLPGVNPDSMDYMDFMASFWGEDASGSRFYSGESGFRESRTDIFSYNAGANVGFSGEFVSVILHLSAAGDKSRYSLDSRANQFVREYSVGFEGLYRSTVGFEIGSRLEYENRKGYADGYNSPVCIWNITLNQNVKAFSFGLKFNDLLNQEVTRWHSVSENYVRDNYINTTGRCILLTFSWNFGKMNAERSSAARDAMYNMSR